MNRENYLLENEQYLKNLNSGLKYLEQISNELLTHNIDIKTKPWYKNLIEIYIPMAFNFYDNCKNIDFDINKDNDLWIRKDYKSFLSEVEKFIKFIIEFILNLKNIDFCEAINELDNVVTTILKQTNITKEELDFIKNSNMFHLFMNSGLSEINVATMNPLIKDSFAEKNYLDNLISNHVLNYTRGKWKLENEFKYDPYNYHREGQKLNILFWAYLE